jgi:asparagine synthase (glutamine-hydrolysing)
MRTLEVVPGAWRARLLGEPAGASVAPALAAPFRDGFESRLSFADAARAADMAVYLPDDLLAKEDRATMAASLENRVPFLDDRVADIAGRIPASRHGLPGLRGDGKNLLRAALRDVLPPEVLRRRKHGFAVPVSEWLRDPLRPLLDDHLTAPDARVRELLDPRAIDALVTRHRSGDARRPSVSA